ncbi:toll-like receptor 18 [Gouania willdenowi]|uniref:Toll-like receptor 2 type-2 n=1 Tax=Gouania willdenowi TaxID=441366 RepID=A0A8C5HCJ2_GOUWI|nr:toll-like receptor 2 type-2 [Gouania willdenowi]
MTWSTAMIWTFIYFSAILIEALTSPTPSAVLSTSTKHAPCRIFSSGRSADCQGRQLNRVPWRQFPSTLEEIDLSFNELQAIHVDDFSRLPRLRILLLKFNNISYIDDEAFKSNTQLDQLDIFNNSLLEIPVKALTPLVNLKVLLMSNNLYEHATLAKSFSRFEKLQTLSMGGPLVMGLKKEDFQALKNIKLQSFAIKCSSNLSYYEPGSVEMIQTEQFGFDMAIDRKPNVLSHMLHDLANKTFTTLQFRNLFEFMYYVGDKDIFQGLSNITADRLIFYRGKFNENLLRMALLNLEVAPIKKLRLQYIDFARSPTYVNNGMGSGITDLVLDELDLWYISNPDVLRFDWSFTWLSKVKQLSIENVYFNSVPCDAFVAMTGVKTLNVPNNRLQNNFVLNQRCDNRGTMKNLLTFNMSINELSSLKAISSLTWDFKHLQVIDVNSNKLGSAEESQDCVWPPNITYFIAHHNEFVKEALMCLPTTLHFLDLSYCKLDQLDMAYFEKATNLKHLLLSGNKIKFIPSKWESPSMKILALDGNSFGIINKDSFQDMPQLCELKAGNNPYYCTCDLHSFMEETLSEKKINLTDWPWNYRCYHPEVLLNTPLAKFFPGYVACDIRLVILICVATTSAVLLILGIICYIFDLPWYTKATYQIVRAKYRARKEKAAGELPPFTYHAFISYSHSDAEWVRDQLLPCLENNKTPYRLCIHERDFTPGRWIIDNIIDNIENSLKIIFVLSRHFVNSEWCNYELYFAQQRAMGKTFSDVILVLKEPIDPSSLPSKFCKLKKMMNTKTYLEWPLQVNQQAFFWAQLKSVLGKPSTSQYRRQSVKSLTSSVGATSMSSFPVSNGMEESAETKEVDFPKHNQRQIPVVAC